MGGVSVFLSGILNWLAVVQFEKPLKILSRILCKHIHRWHL